MILELPLATGTLEEIFNHILDRKDFDMWMPYKDFKDQIEVIMNNKWRVGPIMFYTRNEKNERVIVAQWVVITTPNRFLS
jgi:hypothetical protein